MSAPPAKIVLDQVSIAFGTRLVVQDVSMVLHEHDLLCIVGTSGSGKTTLLRAVAGLLPLYSGRILLDGTLVTRPAPRTAMIFQHFGLFPWKTVRANIAYGLSVQGRRDEDGTLTRLLLDEAILLGDRIVVRCLTTGPRRRGAPLPPGI
jgi:NitT/TauT family transport system ATP-binding protein